MDFHYNTYYGDVKSVNAISLDKLSCWAGNNVCTDKDIHSWPINVLYGHEYTRHITWQLGWMYLSNGAMRSFQVWWLGEMRIPWQTIRDDLAIQMNADEGAAYNTHLHWPSGRIMAIIIHRLCDGYTCSILVGWTFAIPTDIRLLQ